MQIHNSYNDNLIHYNIKQKKDYIKKSFYTSNSISFGKKNIFQKGYDYIFGDGINKTKKFKPTYSIIENDLDFVVELRTFAKNNYNKEEEKRFYNEIYNTLTTDKEKSLFRQHFGRYLPSEQPQQPVRTNTTESQTSNPKNNSQTSQFSTVPKKQTSMSIMTTENLINQINSVEIEDIPAFISLMAKSSRENQYNLANVIGILNKKFVEMDKDDPSYKFKRELREKYSEQLEAEIEEKFKQSGKKFNSTDIIKEKENRLKEMAIKAGYGDVLPETKMLGQKLHTIETQMKKQNISFVPRPNFTYNEENPEQFLKEKFDYIQTTLDYITYNEASAMDALEAFDKYGMRQVAGKSALEALTISSVNAFEKFSNTPVAEKIFNKYLDIFAKYASKDRNDRDASEFGYVLKHCEYDLTKDTMIKLIDVLKPIVYEKSPVNALRTAIYNHPDLLKNIKEDELKEIKEHLAELQEITKNYPDIRPYNGNDSKI